MKTITKQIILKSIGKVYEEAEKCKLENSFFGTIDEELELLSKYFKTTKSQAFYISMVFALNYKGDSVDLNDLVSYFDCNPMKILEYSEDLEYLYSQRIFKKEKSRFGMKLAVANDQFTIHEKITEAILKDREMPDIAESKIEDIIGVLEKLYDFSEQRRDDQISTSAFFREVKKLISESEHFPLIKKVKQFDFDIVDTYVFLYLVRKTISGRESVDISQSLESIYDNPSERFYGMQKFLSDDNVLVKNKLIEIIEADFFNDTEMKLTDYSQNILNECDIKLFLNKNKNKRDDIISPADIGYQDLIFDATEMNQIFLLGDLLEDAKFKEVQNRLISKNLPKGITVLLHGFPGTGKTEIVKQLAKKTDREIMKVEISESKSKWFGESEKIIKRIFTDYKTYAKDCELTPILLFNEADAIISERKEIGNSNVAQVENTIQNIILEELENFEGILVATTNLATHLDTAFERRFLFKIPFNKPSVEIRTKIWKSKLPGLETKECQLLAENFEFSGGQINNIIRKTEIHEILDGTLTNFDTVWSFCLEESIVTKRNQIGFVKY